MTEEEADLKNEIARSTYAGMLHDDERHKKYFEALKCTISEMINQPFIQALDIGCGTGILSMMAAKAGANSVSACEMFKPMGDTAIKVIEQNKLSHIVKVVNKCSTDLEIGRDMSSKANILVTEIFDSELIGEGVLPTLRDAHNRLLTHNCKVIPASADVKVQMIECDKLWSMNKIQSNDLFSTKELLNCPGLACGHEVQVNQLYPRDLKLLSDPITITSFNFHTKHEHIYNNKYSMSKKCISVTQSGMIHAVLFWWDLILHKDKNIVVSMEPKWMRSNAKYVWRDHWMQVVYYLKQPLKVSQNDNVFATMFYDDFSVWFDVKCCKVADVVDRPLCSCGLHMVWCHERFALWNNVEVCQMFTNVITKHEIVSIMGDVSLLPLHSSKTDLKYYECSEYSKQIIQDLVSENNKNTNLIKDYTNGLPFSGNLLIDPYFSSSLLPWHHCFKLWTIAQHVQSVYSNKLKIYPCKAFLKACVVEFSDLWKAYAPIRNVDGFNMKEFDSLIEKARSPVKLSQGFYQDVEPYAMWEYENKLISKPMILAEFNFEKPMPAVETYFSDSLCISRAGIAHAVVLWVDFVMDEEKTFSTGLTAHDSWVDYMRQGVYFFTQPKHYKANEKMEANVVLVPNDSELMFAFS